jgi:hypothetical protein
MRMNEVNNCNKIYLKKKHRIKKSLKFKIFNFSFSSHYFSPFNFSLTYLLTLYRRKKEETQLKNDQELSLINLLMIMMMMILQSKETLFEENHLTQKQNKIKESINN